MPSPAATESAPAYSPEHVSDAAPSRAPPRRSRWRRWLHLLAILLALRLVLSMVVQPLAEESLSRVLGSRVEVGGVRFNPIDAIVTLRHVVLQPAGGGTAGADATPAITADRLRIDVQWLPLLHRSLLLRQVTLEGAHVDLERLRDAGWTLERVQHLDPATELPPGWSFALDRIVLRDTEVRVRDVGAGDIAPLDVTVREAQVPTRRRRASAFGRVPNLRVDAVVDGGRLLIAGSSDVRDDGVAINALVHAKDVPLERFAAYRPTPLTESSIDGHVSGRLQYRRDPGRRERLTGRLRGRRIAVHVPALAEPALAIRRMEAELEGVDLLRGRIAIGTLMLRGARLAVRPDLMAPVPLLDGLAPAPDSPPIDPRRAPRPATWSWTIGHVAAPFVRLPVAGAGEQRVLAANVVGENIGPGAYWSPLRAWISWDGGTAVFDGTTRMTRGFTVEGRLTTSEVEATVVAHALGPPLAALVQDGRIAADLDVEFAPAAAPPLDVRGNISVANLWLAAEDPNAFAFGAQAVDLTVARVVPAERDGSRSQPAEIRFATATLASPHLTMTRTSEGWSAEAALRTAESEPEDATAAVTLAVADVRAWDGRLLVVDQTAIPQLELDLAALDGWARELRLPDAGVGAFELQGTDPRFGALRLTGARNWGELRAEVSAPDVDLAAVAPYFQRAGLPYAFTGGTGAVRSVVSVAGDRWSADTLLTLREPRLGGDEGMLERSLGMAPAAAFVAVRERHGNVMLRLPLASSGWTGARGLNETLAGAVREALTRPRWVALPEAPLRIEFGLGRVEPGPQAARQLEAVAEILAARPDVMVELRGAISPQDRRWLAEQALAPDEIDEPGGFRVLLRAVGVRDQRLRIREALAARGAGEPGRLKPKDEEALAALVAAGPPIADDRLSRLAAARSALMANLLADRHGITAARIVAAEPEAREGSAAAVIDARFLPLPGVTPFPGVTP